MARVRPAPRVAVPGGRARPARAATSEPRSSSITSCRSAASACGVIGHGTGGSLAQALAADGGVDAMVLLDAPRAKAVGRRRILASFDFPVLLLWGEDDEVVPVSVAEELNDAIATSTLGLLPGCGHDLTDEAAGHDRADDPRVPPRPLPARAASPGPRPRSRATTASCGSSSNAALRGSTSRTTSATIGSSMTTRRQRHEPSSPVPVRDPRRGPPRRARPERRTCRNRSSSTSTSRSTRRDDSIEATADYRAITDAVREIVEGGSFDLIEAMADAIARPDRVVPPRRRRDRRGAQAERRRSPRDRRRAAAATATGAPAE